MEVQHQVLLHTLQVVGTVIKADSDSVQSFSEVIANHDICILNLYIESQAVPF